MSSVNACNLCGVQACLPVAAEAPAEYAALPLQHLFDVGQLKSALCSSKRQLNSVYSCLEAERSQLTAQVTEASVTGAA